MEHWTASFRERRRALTIAFVLVCMVLALATAPHDKDREPPPVSISTPVAAPIMAQPTPRPEPVLYRYIVIQESCGPDYEGSCVRARSGPGTRYPVVLQLREGMILRVIDSTERDGRTWYRIGFDEWLRYPERARSMYVAAELVTSFKDAGPETLATSTPVSSKRILVDRSSQMLYAYDGDSLFMRQEVSTGVDTTPTPRGTFTIYYKTPSRYMQGPIPGISTKEYDLPGVPWNLYFTKQGAVIHGAYWHNAFGTPHSNGCVNMPYEAAKELYEWADIGTTVTVRD